MRKNITIGVLLLGLIVSIFSWTLYAAQIGAQMARKQVELGVQTANVD